MPNAYDILGVKPDALDEIIRQRYLALVREFSPELHPQKFAAIRAAYEKLKTLVARTNYRLFQFNNDDTIEELIEDATCQMTRRRHSLDSLLKATQPPGR